MKIQDFLKDKFVKEKGREPNRHELIDLNDKEKVIQMLFERIMTLEAEVFKKK